MQKQIWLENDIRSQWVVVPGIYLAFLCVFSDYYFVQFKQGHSVQEKNNKKDDPLTQLFIGIILILVSCK